MNEHFFDALTISGIALAGVFIFMALFYFIIVGIDKALPNKENRDKEK